MGEPGGLPSMGSHRIGHDWNDLAAAAAADQLGLNSHPTAYLGKVLASYSFNPYSWVCQAPGIVYASSAEVQNQYLSLWSLQARRELIK